uniref:Choline/carnitine acyltransferase domain-containing protein n=1 Tax=Biomphalaria glabrata TaxID=6526 RepID=A0A2C9M389_BIOGL
MTSTSFPSKYQRRLSTRWTTGVPLNQKLLSGNDYNASINTFSRNRKFSEETNRSSLLPRLSIVSNLDVAVGKRVIFKLDDDDEASKERVAMLKGDQEKSQLMKSMITSEAVKYELDRKNKDNVSVYDFFFGGNSDEDFKDYDVSEAVSVNKCELGVSTDINVSFKGNLKHVAMPVFGSFQVPDEIRVQRGVSKQASISTSSSYFMDTLWPWPWLDYKCRSAELYKSSSVKTFTHQTQLPDLPVPAMGHSLQRLLQSMRPFTDAGSLKRVRRLAEEFALNEGSTCQKLILEATSSDRNWIRQVLPNYSRLYSRLAAPVLNRGIVCPFMYDLWPENKDSQLERATILVESAVDFWSILRHESLAPIADKSGRKICMHEFRKLFSSVRIPGTPSDAIFTFFHTLAEKEETPKHIIVIYRGFIFTMDVMDTIYLPMSNKTIKRFLKEIVKSVDEGDINTESHGVCILTSLDRDEWSQVREGLISCSVSNAASLREIETALFVLSLDTLSINDHNRLPHEAMFGDGYNRWYDKNLNFYISGNGLVTVNVNNSLLDGNVVAILLHYIHMRILENVDRWDEGVVMAVSRTTLASTRSRGSSSLDVLLSQIRSRVSCATSITDNLDSEKDVSPGFPYLHSSNTPRRLEFTLNSYTEQYIEKAEVAFSDLAASVLTAVCSFDEYERNLFQEKGVNVDAFAQMVIHCTFYNMYGRFPSVCANVSLKRFYHGRFELMRTSTEEILIWCKDMSSPESTNALKRESFWKAEKKHRQLLRENCSGHGFENHLAALKVIAEDKMMKKSAFFEDELVKYHFESINVFTECLGVGCTSCATVLPISSDGYGVGYFVANTKIVFNVSSWQGETTTSSELFAHALHNTMTLLYNLMHSL